MPTDNKRFMQLALELAQRGQGLVEPNPMVGCVLVRDDEIVGQGFHQRFGESHAELNALASCDSPRGSTAYVTLEPCCHTGKTGPCTQALIEAGVAKTVIAMKDPFSEVAGKGTLELQHAGVEVECGLLADEAIELNRPYLKRITTGMPWVIAKWAMTVDGKIATSTGSSQWISNESSRKIVQELRGRVDAILVGVGTAIADDPLLTARPSGPRTAMRVVLDSAARLPIASQLIKTAREYPLVVCVGPAADAIRTKELASHGCQIFEFDDEDYLLRMRQVLLSLGKLGFTNVLVEGGSKILGAVNDGNFVDEIHCFVGAKIIGGDSSYSPVGGIGARLVSEAKPFNLISVEQIVNDIYGIYRKPVSLDVKHQP